MVKKQKNGQKSSYSYVNHEINEENQDHIGFQAQRDALDDAIDSGAQMIGLIGDYGYGKSSMVGMLTANTDKYDKTIKINMWDGLRQQDNEDVESQELRLEKSFLFQLAKNSEDRDLVKYVNKRLSGNSGLLSITFSSKKIWGLLSLALLSFVIGLIFHMTTVDIPYLETIWNGWQFLLKIDIYPLFYAMSIIFLVIGLKKYNVAFSTWKSEGHRKLDSSDIFSIYQEIVDTICKNKSKNRIILIEDLDRIEMDKAEKENLIDNFIKVLYRLSNACDNKKIHFIVAIRPDIDKRSNTAQTNGDNAGKSENYSKFFDYMLDLKAVHIDDFSKILQELLKEKEQEIRKMFTVGEQDKNIPDSIYGQFSYLIQGRKLTIRDLKHRLNDAIVLYKTICSRQYKNQQGNPSMITCCAVAYLKSEYKQNYYKLVNNDKKFEQIVDNGNLLRIESTSGREEKIGKLVKYIKEVFTGEFELADDFVQEISGMIIDRIIDDNFKQYFFSYPNGSYIKNVGERKLEDVLLLGNSCEENEFINIIEQSFSEDGECKVADACMNQLMQLKKTFPVVILQDERLLEYCYRKYPDQIINTMVVNYPWSKENTESVVETLLRVYSYAFSSKCDLLKKYSEELYKKTTNFNEYFTQCRFELTQKFGNDILLFKNMFIYSNVPCLSSEEVLALSDVNIIFDLLEPSKCTNSLLVALADKAKTELTEMQKVKLVDMIKRHTAVVAPTDEMLRGVLSLMSLNKIVDDTIFKFISKNRSEIYEEIENYLNSLDEPISREYCECLKGYERYLNINDNILNSLYEQKYYSTFLQYCITLNNFETRIYDVSIFDSKMMNELFSRHKSLFTKYRIGLIQQSIEIRRAYKFLYDAQYAILTEEEARIITLEDCLDLGLITRLIQSPSQAGEIFQFLIRSATDAYLLAKFLFENTSQNTKELFKKIPFKKVDYHVLKSAQKEEIAQSYEDTCQFTSFDELIQFADITSDMPTLIEEKIIKKIANTTDRTACLQYIKKFIALLDQLNIGSNKLIDLIIDNDYCGAMPPQITIELRNRHQYWQYIVGRTLYENKFSFDPTIDIDEYILVYVTVDQMFDYMSNCQQFLEAVYIARKFERLSLQQLLIYNTWGQRIELLKAFMEQCKDMEQRKNYILKIERIDSLEDSNSIQRYLCNGQFDELLTDYEIKMHIYNLLWKENSRRKSMFKSYVKKLVS